ncbi:ATP-binding protein [Alishewanella sp. d11]|uniref:ATP-binding protein n=1 Tax=Alishewanella sp. d11 TaxID=3414030 RepID=UPI003BF8350D
MTLDLRLTLLGKAPTVKRLRYFLILSGFGLFANLLSVNLPFIIPFLIGNVVFVTLQLRFGSLWALLGLVVVMLPVNEPVFWFIALTQFLLVAALSFSNKTNVYRTLPFFVPMVALLLYWFGPRALLVDWQHFMLATALIVMLFALNLRASQFLLALSASTKFQKKQHFRQQLSQRIALYSAIPGSLFIALILHAAIVLHLESQVEDYAVTQIKRDAELTSLLKSYQSALALAAEMLNIAEPTAVLTELTKQRPEFISALITDKNGLVTNFFKDGLENEQLQGINVSHRYYFAYPAATGKPVITDSFQGSKLGNDYLFALSHPLFKQDEFAGVIEISVALERLQQVLQPSRLPLEQRILIDSEGRKLWADKNPSGIGSIIDAEQLVTDSDYFLLLAYFVNSIPTMKFSPSYDALIVEHYNELTGWLHQDKIATTMFTMRYHVFLILAMLLSVFMLEFIAWASGRFARSYTQSLEHIANYAVNWTAEDTAALKPPTLMSSSIEFETVLNNLYELKQRVIDSHHQLSTLLALRTELNTELENRVAIRTEELRAERDKAQHLANVKSRFLANMSHEIRTPITVIKGFSEQLLQSQDLDEHFNFSQLIFNNTLHLQRVIDDILDSSKIDEGKLTLVNETFNLKQFLEAIWQSIQPLASNKGINLNLHYELSEQLQLNADPFRLRQILHNLLSNAIKFTATGAVQICVTERAEQLILSVIDQGIGLTEEQISQLFQAFQQADSSTSRRYGGTGLGLYISRHLATLMEMTLEVKSSPGIGSIFSILIPKQKISEQTTAPTLNAVIPDANAQLQGHILIVDDVPDIRLLLVNMLKDSGLHFKTAQNGREALQLAAIEKFDLILMDQQMPEMDGITATTELRHQGFTKPIIRLSADVYDIQYTQQGAGLFDATLAKPITKKELRYCLQQYLATARAEPLKQPAADDDDEEFEQLKNDYKLSLIAKTADLQLLYDNGQFVVLRQELHKIKGTSACFDFYNIAEMATTCETALKNNSLTKEMFIQLLQVINE